MNDQGLRDLALSDPAEFAAKRDEALRQARRDMINEAELTVDHNSTGYSWARCRSFDSEVSFFQPSYILAHGWSRVVSIVQRLYARDDSSVDRDGVPPCATLETHHSYLRID